MNKLNKEKRAQIIKALVEGNSIRATARMCDVAFNTVLKLLPEIDEACAKFQDKVFRNLPCKRIQCDEIWSFCYAKEKMFPMKCAVALATAMFGRGLRLMRIRSLFPAGLLDAVMLVMLITSCMTSPHVWRTEYS